MTKMERETTNGPSGDPTNLSLYIARPCGVKHLPNFGQNKLVLSFHVQPFHKRYSRFYFAQIAASKGLVFRSVGGKLGNSSARARASLRPTAFYGF
jgi:hypothetical protein